MAASIPFYLSAQLRSALQETRDMAVQKGLEQLFALELFSAQQDVDEALTLDDRAAAARAQQRLRDLQSQIRAAPDKSDGMLLR